MSLTHSLSLPNTGFLMFPLPIWEVAADPGKSGRKLHQYMLCHSLQVPVLDITSQSPWASPSTCVHAAVWSPGPSSTSQISFLQSQSSASTFCISFFLRTLLTFGNPYSVHHLFFLGLYNMNFPSIDSLCHIAWITVHDWPRNWWSSQVSFSIGGFRMWHWFNSVTIKIYNQPISEASRD